MPGQAAAATLLSTTEQVLWGGTLIGCAALAVKLCLSALYRTLPFFLVFLLYRLFRTLGLFCLPYGTNLYGWAWAFSAPLFWLAYILVVLELYSLVLRNYPGIAAWGAGSWRRDC